MASKRAEHALNVRLLYHMPEKRWDYEEHKVLFQRTGTELMKN